MASTSDLDRLAGAAIAAGAQLPTPRRPWLPPLPGELALEDLQAAGPPVPFAGERGLTAALALLDEPRAQAQYPAGWNLDAGNLLLFGLGGSGTTTALQTLALSLAAAGPDELHIYVLDFGAGELQSLQGLPHVGAVIAATQRERQARLVRWLHGELAARRDAGGGRGHGRIVVLLDGYAGFAAEHSDVVGDAIRDDLARVWADGPEVGIHIAIAADRPGAVPVALASLAQQRLVLQLGDVGDYAQIGLTRRSIPRFVPGRAVLTATSPRVTQIARSRLPAAEAVAEIAARHGPAQRPPTRIGTLPERVTVAELLSAGQAAAADEEALWLPVAIDSETLAAAGWSLYAGEHALIAGPARSGRTNALIALAHAAATLHPKLPVHAVALRRSRLAELPGLASRATTTEQLSKLVSALRADGGRALLLIDDADAVTDPAGALSGLIGDPDGRVYVIAAGRADGLRSLGHWSTGARASRNGLLITPDLSVDGSLFGVMLPRRPEPPARPGSGYLIRAGSVGLAQAALADPR